MHCKLQLHKYCLRYVVIDSLYSSERLNGISLPKPFQRRRSLLAFSYQLFADNDKHFLEYQTVKSVELSRV